MAKIIKETIEIEFLKLEINLEEKLKITKPNRAIKCGKILCNEISTLKIELPEYLNSNCFITSTCEKHKEILGNLNLINNKLKENKKWK